MKANKLFFLAGVALLMACSGNANHTIGSSRNAESTSSDQTTESTSSSINSDVTSSSSSSSSSSNSSSGSSSSSSSNIPDGTLTKTVTFYNGGFKSTSLDQTTSQNKFVEWFNNGDNTLKSIGYEGKVQINEIDNDKNYTMILGSQKSDGKLTFNFNYYLYSVKAVVQAYTKYYNGTDNNDKNAKFLIDSTEYDLSLPSDYTGPSERKTFTQELDGSSKSFSIANKDNNQRVFVHSLEITYYTVD